MVSLYYGYLYTYFVESETKDIRPWLIGVLVVTTLFSLIGAMKSLYTQIQSTGRSCCSTDDDTIEMDDWKLQRKIRDEIINSIAIIQWILFNRFIHPLTHVDVLTFNEIGHFLLFTPTHHISAPVNDYFCMYYLCISSVHCAHCTCTRINGTCVNIMLWVV